MNKKLCMNALGVIEGTEKASRELVQAVAGAGAFAFHEQWRNAMKAAGWRDGGHLTNEDLLYTPHVREWALLVDGQRAPLLALEKSKVEAEWADTASDEVSDDTE